MSDDPTQECVPPFLPPAFLQAIGNLTAYWGYLESAMEVVIWCFLKVPRFVGVAVTTHMGTVAREQALSTLAENTLRESEPEVFDMFTKLLVEIEETRIARNAIVHAFWKHEPRADATEAHLLRITAKGKFKQSKHTMTVEQIKAATARTNSLMNQLQGFAEAMFPDADLPWPRTEIGQDGKA